jgi:DNA (cytosine-5)-methyltransferase 1
MTHFDLFSGYGGFTLALEKVYDYFTHKQVGVRGDSQNISSVASGGEPQLPITIGFSEIDKYASAVLKYHWPNIKNYGDITKNNWAEVPDFDLLTGGSPCQDLSIAGKRAGLEGARSGLFYEYMRAVKEKRPKYFIWENVKGALSSNKGFDFAAVINEMAEAGYSLWWQVLNAKDFGVPQNRERIFVVGFRDQPAPEVFFERGQGNENSTVSESTKTAVARTLTGGGHTGGNHSGMTILQLNNPVHSNDRLYLEDGLSPALNTTQGGLRQPFIQNPKMQNYKKDYENSVAITATSYKEPPVVNAIRRLTPTECERLMGLPDDWTSAGGTISDSQRYKLCGNGVVVNVVEELIKNLL